LELVIRQATVSDLDGLVLLFDGYRQFYRQPSEPDRIRRFLLDHFEHNQSVIFIAMKDGAPVGFTQLYPSFSSGALMRIFILNDLLVDPGARLMGAGSALLQTAQSTGGVLALSA
jgi:GNAT superfamily N-acetyltransferase